MIETAITIARAVKAGVDIYGTVSAILRGKQSNYYLEKISGDLGNIRIEFERISNHITMATNLDAVRDITQNRQRRVESLRDIREILEPVQRAIGDDILSSAMIWTPEKMKKAMGKNPWEVLLFIQPVALAKPPNDPNLMPIIFEHSGIQYIGWQAKGTFPMLFDCQYEELWKPNDAESQETVSSHDTQFQYQPGVTYIDSKGEFHGPEPQYELGWMYETGFNSAARDMTEAVKWYRKAAEQGHIQAQLRLGLIYERGEGVAQDPIEAVKWYRKAAAQGDAHTQVNLGLMYERGEGVAQDPAEAVKWYRKAAAQGDAWGQNNLGWMYANGEGVAQDPAEAVKWYRKAAAQGNAHAQANLGLMYETGRGVTQSDAEAIKWYTKAAEQSNDFAKERLRDYKY